MTFSGWTSRIAAVVVVFLITRAADAQEIRNYNVQFTTNTIVADGVISPGEWDGATSAAGDWRELRKGFEDVDSDNNRFQLLYDDNNLYILYETDYVGGPDNDQWLTDLGGNPAIVFDEENLNIYIDPNRDGDLNFNPDTGMPSTPTTPHDAGVDGYQVAFNQYLGTHISTNADRQGIGFFTEAHANLPLGDHANWNQGADPMTGPALGEIVVAQTNTNSPAAGQPSGIAEIVIPFSDLDADAMIPAPPPNADYNGDGSQDAADYTVWRDQLGADVGNAGNGLLDGADGNDNGLVDEGDYTLWKGGFGRGPGAMAPTGLNATDGAQPGEVWGFNMSMITRDGDSGENYLPIWNWHSAGGFAAWPHGTITFVAPVAEEAGATAVPEPSSMVLMLLAVVGVWRWGTFCPLRNDSRITSAFPCRKSHE